MKLKNPNRPSPKSDFVRLFDWSKDWQMLLAGDFLHTYTLGSNVITLVEEERDFGVIIYESLNH